MKEKPYPHTGEVWEACHNEVVIVVDEYSSPWVTYHLIGETDSSIGMTGWKKHILSFWARFSPADSIGVPID